MNDECKQCKFYEVLFTPGERETGHCYRYPPRVIVILEAPSPTIQSVIPTVKFDRIACGEFAKTK